LDIAPSLSLKDTHAVGMFSDRGEVYNLQLAKKPGFSRKTTRGNPSSLKTRFLIQAHPTKSTQKTMSYNNQDFVKDLDKAPQARKGLANLLTKMQDKLNEAESIGENENASGKLELETDIKALSIEIDKLNNGIFRLLVLGEMNRGKSTFINALFGEKDLLPTAVNPCTAIPTVVRYGREKEVTVYYNDGKKPARLDFNTFKERYTIKKDEATKLEADNKKAFPDVDYAVVEYPLEILSKGVEIVDSPGLNDTKDRDAITLDYIAKCHAILYVLSAIQQFNQNEREYLRTRIQGRGLAVFFLINGWDEIERRMLDPEDPKEVETAKKDIRNRFAPLVSDYLQSENKTDYEKWVFEISSLNALRCKIKNQPLDGTGFPELTKTLVNFLKSDRLKSELLPAIMTSQRTQKRVADAIQRRIPLLDQPVAELEETISSVQPLFNQLTNLRNGFAEEIRQVQKKSADEISESFKEYVNNLAQTFDSDFFPYQPELKDNTEEERKKFLSAVEKAFVNYLQDKISDWRKKETEPLLKDACLRLANFANMCLPSYVQTTDQITQKLLKNFQANANLVASPNSANVSGNMNLSVNNPGNISDVLGIGGGIGGGLFGALGGSYLGGALSLGLSALLPSISSTILLTGLFAPIGILMVLGSIWGVKEDKKDHYISEAKKQLKEQLPHIASEKASSMSDNVRESFSNSLKVVQEMDNDIRSQKAQLNNLLEQKKKNQINIESEKKRLQELANTVANIIQEIVEFAHPFIS
jgi:predicted GTPase